MEILNNSVCTCVEDDCREIDIIREIDDIKADSHIDTKIDYKHELESRHNVLDLWWNDMYAEYARSWFKDVCDAHPITGYLINLEHFGEYYMECEISEKMEVDF